MVTQIRVKRLATNVIVRGLHPEGRQTLRFAQSNG